MLSNVFQKNIRGALMVLKQMEHEDVKPDSQTFSYLIGNCESEEDITKVVCNFVVCSKFHVLPSPFFLDKFNYAVLC